MHANIISSCNCEVKKYHCANVNYSYKKVKIVYNFHAYLKI